MKKERPAVVLTSPLGMQRREFLASLVAAGGLVACGTSPQSSLGGGTRGAGAATPFPADIPLYFEDYENWTRQLSAPNLRTFAPTSAEDVVSVCNWAHSNAFTVRARGMRHGWSPLTISASTTSETPMVLGDTTQHLTRAEIVDYEGITAVRAEAGVLVEDLMAFLTEQGFGFTAVTAVGEITIAGALAINGHGSAIPTASEASVSGQTYGSFSNRILSLTAVVWNDAEQRYGLREIDRRDPDIGPLLTSLGRTFITEVTLMVEPDHKLRCQSHVDISAAEMFAAPGSGGRDIESFLQSAGRIESIWYAYTDNPWLKVWSVSPEKPLTSREVTAPYNYPFSDNIPDAVSSLAQDLVSGNPEAAPLFGQTTYAVTAAGLAATLSLDIWGVAKDTLMFIKPTTLRVHESSYAVLTRRDNVQNLIHQFTNEYLRLQQVYRDRGSYPSNMPVEYRVTGLDSVTDVDLAGAQAATLSALHPRDDHPEWDTAVWLSVLTLPGTPDSFAFFRELEQWLYDNIEGNNAALRPEWSKGWAYTDQAAWADETTLGTRIPDIHRAGRNGADWDSAMATFERLDPGGIFQNEFLTGLTKT